MTTNRLEAFSDGVLAIIITIMVLELVPPHGHSLAALEPLVPKLLSYLLSFIYVGIYWNNHHHTFQAAQRVTGSVLWANLHLLFWLSLVPFTTAWAGENHFAATPTALYGGVLLCASLAFMLLWRTLIRAHDEGSAFVRAVAGDRKVWITMAVYLVAIPLSFVNAWIGWALYALGALMWLIPDRRLEHGVPASGAPAE